MSSFAIDRTCTTAHQRAITVTSAVVPPDAYAIVDSTIAVSALSPQCVVVPNFATAVRSIHAAGQMPVIVDAGLAAQHMDSPWLTHVGETSLIHDATKYMRALAKPPRLGVTVRFGLVERGADVIPAIGRDALSLAARHAAACELLWAIGGSRGPTPAWRHATSRPALDARDLVCYRPGECGPVYGHQWRAWGSLWYCESSPTKRPLRGIDQLSMVIEALRAEAGADCDMPNHGPPKAHIVSAWAADDLDEMAREPTHHAFQLILRGLGANATLDCAVSMTRADLWTELPYVVTMYALLTHMIARVVGVRAGSLAVTVADAHGRADQAAVPMRAVPVTMLAAESIDDYVRAGVDAIKFAW